MYINFTSGITKFQLLDWKALMMTRDLSLSKTENMETTSFVCSTQIYYNKLEINKFYLRTKDDSKYIIRYSKGVPKNGDI